MRFTAPSVLVLAMMTLAAMPPANATHGDTAYLVSLDPTFLFVAETYYVNGPGYTNQNWNFNIVTAAGSDFCPLVNGGWDPDNRVNPPLPGGFRGTCVNTGPFSTTGIDHFHNYPNPQGYDTHVIRVTYDGVTFDAQLVICDSAHPRLVALLGRTYCNDMLLL